MGRANIVIKPKSILTSRTNHTRATHRCNQNRNGQERGELKILHLVLPRRKEQSAYQLPAIGWGGKSLQQKEAVKAGEK